MNIEDEWLKTKENTEQRNVLLLILIFKTVKIN